MQKNNFEKKFLSLNVDAHYIEKFSKNDATQMQTSKPIKKLKTKILNF